MFNVFRTAASSSFPTPVAKRKLLGCLAHAPAREAFFPIRFLVFGPQLLLLLLSRTPSVHPPNLPPVGHPTNEKPPYIYMAPSHLFCTL